MREQMTTVNTISSQTILNQSMTLYSLKNFLFLKALWFLETITMILLQMVANVQVSTFNWMSLSSYIRMESKRPPLDSSRFMLVISTQLGNKSSGSFHTLIYLGRQILQHCISALSLGEFISAMMALQILSGAISTMLIIFLMVRSSSPFKTHANQLI